MKDFSFSEILWRIFKWKPLKITNFHNLSESGCLLTRTQWKPEFIHLKLSSGKIEKSGLANFICKQALSRTWASVLENKWKINHGHLLNSTLEIVRSLSSSPTAHPTSKCYHFVSTHSLSKSSPHLQQAFLKFKLYNLLGNNIFFFASLRSLIQCSSTLYWLLRSAVILKITF